MAEQDFSATGFKESETECVLSSARQFVVLEAASEAEMLCKSLRAAIGPTDSGLHYLVRGLTIRLEELSLIIQRAAGDPSEKIAVLSADLRKEVAA